ncbi:MAG: PLP-dependent aspartate aminotransferase family protein [Phycisphaeraceae bacterium]
MRFETRAIHTGVYQDQTFNSVTTPIYPSSNFYFDAPGKHKGYDYTRSGNPTRAALEANLASLENGSAAVATATGMAAITLVTMLFKSGDHIIAGNDIYGGTYRLFDKILPDLGITFSFVDLRNPRKISDAVLPHTKAIWIETPSNPLLNIIDIEAVVAAARQHQLVTIADNTFLSPCFQKPLDLGVDIVVHSTTKYINGHSDVVGGAVIAKLPQHVERIQYLCNALGVACSPFDAFLVLRGLKTLPLRMKQHEINANALAQWLNHHPRVRKVYYPGLPTHTGHDIALRQQTGFGGMLSCDVDAPPEKLPAFFEAMRIFLLAESLGGVESLIEQPWTMSHASMGEKGLRESGITPQTLRISVGLEHVDDLKEDLERGFAAV